MNNVSNFVGYGKTFLINSTYGVITNCSQSGLRGIYRIYSIEGFTKLSKAFLATCDLIVLCRPIGNAFQNIAKAFSAQKDALYGVMFIDSLGDFIRTEEVELHGKKVTRLAFGLPATSKICIAIGSFFETGKALQKYAGFKFETFSRIGSALGSFKINDTLVFSYRPLSLLCNNPKDFFIFIASVVDISNSLYRFAATPDSITPADVAKAREKELSTENIFKQAGNLGKILLILLSSTYGGTKEFIGLNFATQYASLLSFYMAKK